MTWATCCECGLSFHREDDQRWRVRCIPCFKRFKQADSRPADSYWSDRAILAESAAATLKREVEQLKRQLFAEMHKPTQSYLEDEIREHLRGLLQCCHPDRHNGSEGATKTTQWLLSVKQRISNQCSNPW